MKTRLQTNVRQLVQVALLVAIEVVLSRFCSIATPLVKIGFGFVPIAVAGMLYGPLWAGVAGAAADLIGALLFPIGAYFPGFTLTAFLVGCVYGACLHRGADSWRRVLLAVALVSLPLHLLLNTYWVAVISGNAVLALLPLRLTQCLIMAPVQFVLIRLLVSRQLVGRLAAPHHS